jgi:hypothetical protein
MKIIDILLVGSIIILIIISIQVYCKNKHKSLLEVLHPSWYKDVNQFPRNDFKCKKDCITYNEIVKNGYDKMKNTKIIFCGLCINIEDKVESIKKRYENLGNYFYDYRVVIFENDSTDNTRDLLKNVSKENNKFILIDCPDVLDCKYRTIQAKDHGVFSDMRMKKMVTYRNKLLHYIKNNYNYFDIICMVDLDITGPIDVDGVAHSFGKYDSWDCISAYGLNGITLTAGQPYYYDFIAYKDDKYDINKNITDLIPVYNKMNSKKIGDEIIKVQSGFAGLELIKMYVLLGNIDYTPRDDKYMCEHIIFHNNMIRNNFNNIYINPNMVVLVGVQGNAKKFYVY